MSVIIKQLQSFNAIRCPSIETPVPHSGAMWWRPQRYPNIRGSMASWCETIGKLVMLTALINNLMGISWDLPLLVDKWTFFLFVNYNWWLGKTDWEKHNFSIHGFCTSLRNLKTLLWDILLKHLGNALDTVRRVKWNIYEEQWQVKVLFMRQSLFIVSFISHSQLHTQVYHYIKLYHHVTYERKPHNSLFSSNQQSPLPPFWCMIHWNFASPKQSLLPSAASCVSPAAIHLPHGAGFHRTPRSVA